MDQIGSGSFLPRRQNFVDLSASVNAGPLDLCALPYW